MLEIGKIFAGVVQCYVWSDLPRASLRDIRGERLLRKRLNLTLEICEVGRCIVDPGKSPDSYVLSSAGITGVILGTDLQGDVSECGGWRW